METDLRVLLRKVELADLGGRVKNARIAAGLTQAELAASDASIAYVSRIESGQRRPDFELLVAFASRLKVSLEELLLGVSSDTRAVDRLQLDYAELALRSSDPKRAVDLTRDLLERHSASPERDFAERVRLTHAVALEVVGDMDNAMDALESLLADDTTSLSTRARAATALSRCYRESGDLGRAITVGETTMAELTSVELDATDEALQLVATIAAAYFERGDVTYATRLCRRAVGRTDELSSPAARASIYWNASIMQSQRGDAAGALPLAERALALLVVSDDLANVSRLRAQLAVMQLQLDPPELAAATAALERAAAEFEALGGTVVDRARTTFHLGKARFLSGDLEGARALATSAVAESEGRAPTLEADGLALLGQLDAADGDLMRERLHRQDGRTRLVVSHRLGTLERVDQILVLAHGRVVEAGTHAQLVQSGGIYSRLINRADQPVSAGSTLLT